MGEAAFGGADFGVGCGAGPFLQTDLNLEEKYMTYKFSKIYAAGISTVMLSVLLFFGTFSDVHQAYASLPIR